MRCLYSPSHGGGVLAEVDLVEEQVSLFYYLMFNIFQSYVSLTPLKTSHPPSVLFIQLDPTKQSWYVVYNLILSHLYISIYPYYHALNCVELTFN